MLLTIDQVLTPDEVRQFRQQLDQARWEDGARTAGSLARHAKRNEQLDARDPVCIALGQQLVRRLGAMPQFITAALPRRIYPPKFNRYAGGGTYGAHIDASIMAIPGTDASLRTDLSATLFLSEPDEYDGGELEIEGASGVQPVKLAAGDMVLYPATSLHQVTPVTRGARIAAFFWVESLVPDERARALLFDLDQAIQGLAPALDPQDSRLLQLTGVYHNLVRRWAST